MKKQWIVVKNGREKKDHSQCTHRAEIKRKAIAGMVQIGNLL